MQGSKSIAFVFLVSIQVHFYSRHAIDLHVNVRCYRVEEISGNISIGKLRSFVDGERQGELGDPSPSSARWRRRLRG
jgi:hypothetical protein